MFVGSSSRNEVFHASQYKMIGPAPMPFNRNEEDEEAEKTMLLYLLLEIEETNERAGKSYARSISRTGYRLSFMDRCGSLIDTEYVCIFRMKRSAMETLHHSLFPFLQVRLSANNVAGRRRGNRRPLTVDEKICLGLMYMGGCSIGGLLWGFHISKAAIYYNVWQFVLAVLRSDVGEIRFPDTIRELQDASDDFLRTRCNHPALHGCVAAGDGLAVRIKMPSKKESKCQML